MKPWFAGERGAYFFLLLGIGLIGLFALLEWRLPAAGQLQTATGRVTWNQSTRGALYFALGDGQRRFVLYAKGDAEGRQRAAVLDAVMYPLSVRFDQKGHERPFQKAVIVDVVDGYLNAGDHIVVRLGDRRGGGAGTRVQTFVEDRFRFRCYVDPLGTSRFAPVPGDAERIPLPDE